MLGAETCLTILQHVPYEPPGRIAIWALEQGLGIERVRLWAGDPLPEAGDLDALVVLGGPMSVHDTDEHAWLADEVDLIRAAIEADVPVLGVCLGAQQIAHALGGAVEPMPEREIGFHPVETTAAASQHALTDAWPDRFSPLHWHGERFQVPREAALLASSSACEAQAFALGEHVLALQFHLELASVDVEALAEAAPEDLEPGPHVQTREAMLAEPERFEAAGALLDGTLEALFGHLST